MFHFKDNYGKELRCSNISGIYGTVYLASLKVMFCVDTLCLKTLIFLLPFATFAGLCSVTVAFSGLV